MLHDVLHLDLHQLAFVKTAVPALQVDACGPVALHFSDLNPGPNVRQMAENLTYKTFQAKRNVMETHHLAQCTVYTYI